MSAALTEYFVVEEGMPNPRNGEVGWRQFDVFVGTPEGKAQAIRAAKKLSLGRVVRCAEVWVSPNVVPHGAPAPRA